MHSIYAVIILFNPELDKLTRNLNAILPQVEKVILVDNASHKQSVMDEICLKYCNCHLIRNCENFGIAKALNQGIKYAEDAGAEWVVTLDQDSECSPIMIDEYKKYIMNKDVGIFCPIELDRNYFKTLQIGHEIQEIDKCITSGNMVRVEAWKNAGKFQEELFIDYVDYDFCMRIRKKNYKICRVNMAVLVQEVGNAKNNHKLLWKNPAVGNHNSVRKYYIFRNWHYYTDKYFQGKYRYAEKYKMLKFFLKTIIYEDRKFEKIEAMVRGYKDTSKLIDTMNDSLYQNCEEIHK